MNKVNIEIYFNGSKNQVFPKNTRFQLLNTFIDLNAKLQN